MRTIKLPESVPLAEIKAFADNLGLQVRRTQDGALSLTQPQASVLPFRSRSVPRMSPDFEPQPPRGAA